MNDVMHTIRRQDATQTSWFLFLCQTRLRIPTQKMGDGLCQPAFEVRL